MTTISTPMRNIVSSSMADVGRALSDRQGRMEAVQWNLNTGHLLRRVPVSNGGELVAVSSDARILCLLFRGKSEVQTWDLDRGVLLAVIKPQGLTFSEYFNQRTAFLPDSRSLRLWMAEGRPDSPLTRHRSPIFDCLNGNLLSRDGEEIRDFDQSLGLWLRESNQPDSPSLLYTTERISPKPELARLRVPEGLKVRKAVLLPGRALVACSCERDQEVKPTWWKQWLDKVGFALPHGEPCSVGFRRTYWEADVDPRSSDLSRRGLLSFFARGTRRFGVLHPDAKR